MDIYTVVNKLPPNHPLLKSKLVYEVIVLIGEKRKVLLDDLIAYTSDPVRYKRRMRMLTQLSEYEHQILIKLDNFDFTDADICNTFETIAYEIRQVVNINA